MNDWTRSAVPEWPVGRIKVKVSGLQTTRGRSWVNCVMGGVWESLDLPEQPLRQRFPAGRREGRDAR